MLSPRKTNKIETSEADRLIWIPCDEITPNRYQPRKEFKPKELEELAESIDSQGLLQPITVRMSDDLPEGIKYELIAGERRWRATKDILGKEKIRAVVTVMSNEASQEAAITENLQRQDLNPIEEASAILQLMEINSLTQDQVAKRLGKSRAYISNVTRLVRLTEETITLVTNGSIDRSKASALLAVTDPDQQTKLAKQTVAKNWTVEKLRDEIEKFIASNTNTEQKVVRRTINGKSTIVATPSRAHRRKVKPKVEDAHLVLVELDNEKTVEEFISYMKEQNWKCWAGKDLFKQIDAVKNVNVVEEKKESEPLDLFDNEDLSEELETLSEDDE